MDFFLFPVWPAVLAAWLATQHGWKIRFHQNKVEYYLCSYRVGAILDISLKVIFNFNLVMLLNRQIFIWLWCGLLLEYIIVKIGSRFAVDFIYTQILIVHAVSVYKNQSYKNWRKFCENLRTERWAVQI